MTSLRRKRIKLMTRRRKHPTRVDVSKARVLPAPSTATLAGIDRSNRPYWKSVFIDISKEELERLNKMTTEDYLIEYLDKKIARMKEEDAK